MSVTRAYGARALVGGGIGAMDKIDGSLLNDQDKCFTVTETAAYLYNLDEFSGETEDYPKIIAPDSEVTSGGNKRWKLIGVITDSHRGRNTMITGVSSLSVSFDYPFDDTNYNIEVSLLNVTDGSPSQYGITITAKSVSGFNVAFSGAMDSDNYELHWFATRDLI